MASASSVSTYKISGTNVNTVAIDFDEWAEKKAEPAEPVYVEFNTNPLALVCAMIRNGKQPYEAIEVLNGVGNRTQRQINTDHVIDQEDRDLANEILRYFNKKHTVRRLKNAWISEYMLAIDEIAMNPCRVNQNYLRILVTLPRIYKQNRAVEGIIKGRNSSKKIDSISWTRWQGQLEFVEKLHYKAGRSNELHYYFSTPKNYLFRVVLKKGEYGETAWDVLSQMKQIHIDSDVVWTFGVTGYDFNVLQFSPQHTKIEVL